MTNQAVLSDEMRPNTDQVAREYLEARALLRERGREDREIREDQKRREGILMAFLEDTNKPIRLDGFDEEIYIGTRTRKKMAPTGETTEKSAVKVRTIELRDDE